MALAGLEAPGSAVRNRPGETTGESLVLGLRLRGPPFFLGFFLSMIPLVAVKS